MDFEQVEHVGAISTRGMQLWQAWMLSTSFAMVQLQDGLLTKWFCALLERPEENHIKKRVFWH